MLARTPDFSSGSRRRRDAEEVAIRAFSWIAWDARETGFFLDTTGLTSPTIREAAKTPRFLAGVLDYVVGDPQVLRRAARVLGMTELAIDAARRELLPSMSITGRGMFGPGPLEQRCEHCQRTRPLDRRAWPHLPAAVSTVAVPRCGPCGGGFDQPET